MRRTLWRLAMLALALGAWSALDRRGAGREVTVYAASSLQPALEEAADLWLAQAGRAPPSSVRFSFGSSGQVARQVRGGAPAHVVVTADPAWMEWLVAADAVRAETALDFLANGLVVVGRRGIGSAFVFEIPAETLLRTVSNRVALGDPDHVPAGRYGRQALEAMGVWESLTGRLLTAASARDALRLVETGEADLGVVYASDAAAGGADVLEMVPADLHDPIVYTLAATQEAPHAAAEFMGFLFTPQARAVFVAHGLTPLVVLP